uniref:hypothetical protein n=1 Tax=Tenacibaculum ovolyticum TaxID=104270 RepID=UPI000B2CF3A2
YNILNKKGLTYERNDLIIKDDNVNFLEITFEKKINEKLIEYLNKVNKDIESFILDKNNFGKFFIIKENDNKIMVPKKTDFYKYNTILNKA